MAWASSSTNCQLTAHHRSVTAEVLDRKRRHDLHTIHSQPACPSSSSVLWRFVCRTTAHSTRDAHHKAGAPSRVCFARGHASLATYLFLELGFEHCLDSLLDGGLPYGPPQAAAVEPQIDAMRRDCPRQIGHDRWLGVLLNSTFITILVQLLCQHLRIEGQDDVRRSPLPRRLTDGLALPLANDEQRGEDLVSKYKDKA